MGVEVREILVFRIQRKIGNLRRTTLQSCLKTGWFTMAKMPFTQKILQGLMRRSGTLSRMTRGPEPSGSVCRLWTKRP